MSLFLKHAAITQAMLDLTPEQNAHLDGLIPKAGTAVQLMKAAADGLETSIKEGAVGPDAWIKICAAYMTMMIVADSLADHLVVASVVTVESASDLEPIVPADAIN